MGNTKIRKEQMNSGSATNGYVATADGSGGVTWEAVAAGSGASGSQVVPIAHAPVNDFYLTGYDAVSGSFSSGSVTGGASGSQIVPIAHTPVTNFYLTGYDDTSGSFSSGSVVGGTSGSGGLEDAPSDGTTYGRNSGSWVEVQSSGSSGATALSQLTDVSISGSQINGQALVWNSGSGLWMPSASQLGSYSPNDIPTSPSAIDDEFNSGSGSVLPNWTVTTSGSPSWDVNTTWKSWLYANFTGDQQIVISKAYAPAGAFTVTMRVSYSTQANYQQLSITAYDSDESDAILCGYGYGGTLPHAVGFVHSRDSSSWNYNRKSLVLPLNSCVYVHMQRDASNNWRTWISFDGMSYWPVSTVYSKTLTVHHVNITLAQAGATNPTRAGVDWVRFNWITL